MISLLCHDIGYVRGVCRGDRNGHYICNEDGDLVPVSDLGPAVDRRAGPEDVTYLAKAQAIYAHIGFVANCEHGSVRLRRRDSGSIRPGSESDNGW